MLFEKYIKKQFFEEIRNFTSFGDPLILLLIAAIVTGFSSNLLQIIAGLIIIELICSIIKLIYYKDRPNKEGHSNFLEKIDAGSFPSIHTARSSFVFLVLFMLAVSYVKWIFIALLLIVGLTRILLNKHYYFDVIVGYIIGILTFALWWGI